MNEIDELVEIMRNLRDPEKGCPWDKVQTLESILPYTLEEVHELIDAIERKSMDETCDELGDLLYHIVFYAQLAAESREFDFRSVVRRIIKKLLRRHPHVFTDAKISTIEEQKINWEAIKSGERKITAASTGDGQGLMAGISETLPEVMRSLKIQRRAAGVGFDWDDAEQVCSKIAEELIELQEEVKSEGSRNKTIEEFGDLFFSCINLARHLDIDPDMALKKTNIKFIRRFEYMEKKLKKNKRTLSESSIKEMEILWQEAKDEVHEEQG